MPETEPLPLNREQAHAAVVAVRDPAVKRLLELALGAATARFVRWDGLTDAEFADRRPEASFDLRFFVDVLNEALQDGDRIRRVLSGDEPIDLFEPQ